MWKLWPVGKIFGTELKLHGTWIIMLALYALSGYFSGGPAQAMLTVLLALCLFGSVVLHELGHIAAYKHYKMRAQDIILTPIGGIARGLGQPKNARQEMVIAAAGPAVNAVLAALCWATLQVTPWAALGSSASLAYSLTLWSLKMNIVLGLFNLLPALPMDGGRILRAMLTTRMGFLKATQRAAQVARWTTAAMAVYAIYAGSISLLVLAGAVYLMSYAELAQAHAAQAQSHPLFSILRGFGGGGGGFAGGGPGRPRGASSIVDQFGNPVSGGPGSWSSAEHVQPTSDGQGWTVKSVRWLDN